MKKPLADSEPRGLELLTYGVDLFLAAVDGYFSDVLTEASKVTWSSWFRVSFAPPLPQGFILSLDALFVPMDNLRGRLRRIPAQVLARFLLQKFARQPELGTRVIRCDQLWMAIGETMAEDLADVNSPFVGVRGGIRIAQRVNGFGGRFKILLGFIQGRLPSLASFLDKILTRVLLALSAAIDVLISIAFTAALGAFLFWLRGATPRIVQKWALGQSAPRKKVYLRGRGGVILRREPGGAKP